MTFLVLNGYDDEEYFRLIRFVREHKEAVWIVKPGENSNRGCGITLCKDEKELEREI